MRDVLEIKIKDEVLFKIELHGPTLMSGTQKLLLSVISSALTHSNVRAFSLSLSVHIQDWDTQSHFRMSVLWK